MRSKQSSRKKKITLTVFLPSAMAMIETTREGYWYNENMSNILQSKKKYVMMQMKYIIPPSCPCGGTQKCMPSSSFSAGVRIAGKTK